ncbi:hypothetical protein AT15_02660 [Kosmotoga arenicorallina S304]|uniref:FAD-binding domain-containing protein n=1 Tax=Kosmotoga arenicorallina S304 TaxID=1453497 RepID=A0A176K354_9BACT|nr:NAD(P)/FAD-dependent oxidoreductase [Kosmotoga arenicorallina]OAA31745.1 hypothetical protein AT15_02660 [Kosmotoga arenicorallina S304]
MQVERYDVIVIGAGPAGCAASKILSENGARVLLIDKFGYDKDKGCGGGLTPKALRLLKKIFPRTRVEANPVRKLAVNYGKNGQTKKVCSLLFKNPIFYITTRSILDGELLKAAIESGLEFKKERAIAVEKSSEFFKVKTDNTEFHADYVLIAAGVFGLSLLTDKFHQKYSSIVHFKAKKLSNAASLTFFENGYVWYFPGVEKASIGSGVYSEGKQSFYKSMDNLKSTRYEIPENIDYRVTPIPDFSLDFIYKANELMDGCLLIGDSAGLVDSWTGEGISYALYSGMVAAKSIIKYRNSGLNKKYLRELQPILENLVMAVGLRNSFLRNFPEKVQLIKDKKFARLLFSYVSIFSKSIFGLGLKSYFIPGAKVRIESFKNEDGWS